MSAFRGSGSPVTLKPFYVDKSDSCGAAVRGPVDDRHRCKYKAAKRLHAYASDG